MKEELFCMIDIEADGDIPGASSMLSFAGVTLNKNKEVLGSFEANLQLLPNTKPTPKTMEFWSKNKEAYEKTRINPVDPKYAMEEFDKWLNTFDGNVFFVGYPAPYDHKWIDWYSYYFLGHSHFGHSKIIDMKMLAWGLIKGRFGQCSKKNFPKRWKDKLPHTHVAIDDAIEQGAMFINILREHLGLEKIDGLKYIEGYQHINLS